MFNRDLYTPTFIRLIFSNLFFWMSVNYLVPVLPVHFHPQGYTTDTIGMIVGFFALGARDAVPLLRAVHLPAAPDGD